MVFIFNDTATTEIYTLSLHDALPIFIEVGVDVPNATLMVIDNAERMGLAQLHQLRGRVGRGPAASTCVLLYRAPLSAPAPERLRAIRESSDGFEIARRSLEMRGPGELLGTLPTGLAQHNDPH